MELYYRPIKCELVSAPLLSPNASEFTVNGIFRLTRHGYPGDRRRSPSSRADCALRKSMRGSRRTAPRTIAFRRSLSASRIANPLRLADRLAIGPTGYPTQVAGA